MSVIYTGSGEALVVKSNCNKLVPFTSSYKYIDGGSINYSLWKIEYNNSFIGSRTLSAIANYGSEISSDGSLNFNAEYFYDSVTEVFYIYLSITGVYKKCNYASFELDSFIYNPASSSSAASRDSLKKKSGSSEKFHKLLDSNPNLKKKYLQIKAKLGK
jgi:hypothetical protein